MSARAWICSLLALAVLLAVATPVRAGTYTVHSCAGPGGARYTADGWTAWAPNGPPAFSSAGDGCPAGPYSATVAGDVAQPANVALLGIQFTAPTGTDIAGYRIWRSAQVSTSVPFATPLYWFAWPSASYTGDNVKEQCAATGCSSVGNHAAPFGAANLIRSPGPMTGVRELFLIVGCGGGDGSACPAREGPLAQVRLHGAEIDLRDEHDPVFAAPPSGTLLAARGRVSGRRGVTVTARDAGGGLASAAVIAGRRVVASQPFPDNDGRCRRPYAVRVPCRLEATASVDVDTRRLRNGTNQLRVVILDAAGNAAVAGPFAVRVRNRRPTAALRAAVDNRWSVDRHGTRVARLRVRRAPRGGRVSLRCRGGARRRCPFARRSFRIGRSGRVDLERALRGRRLRPGARLQIRITARDRSAKLVGYRIRAGDIPAVARRCRPGGAKRFGRCG